MLRPTQSHDKAKGRGYYLFVLEQFKGTIAFSEYKQCIISYKYNTKVFLYYQ